MAAAAAAFSSKAGVVLSIYFLAAALIAAMEDPILENSNVYIVHMDLNHKSSPYQTNSDWYSAHLQSLFSTTQEDVAESQPQLIHVYEIAFTGFAVFLRNDQAALLRNSPAVLAVIPNTVYTLHTTRTPNFLGLDMVNLSWLPGTNTKQLSLASQNVIIGVLDTGVWPHSPSFYDTDMLAIPSGWKGKCEKGFQCNNKLIGATSYYQAYTQLFGSGAYNVTDDNGHGTHTASTAAGNHVAHASVNGFAPGEARGMAYQARVAAYKVCWPRTCMSADILMAIEQAIKDGVHVLSMSIGSNPLPYQYDHLAVGAFAAMANGIFVSCSAGNSGPKLGTLSNGAPWIMTVGAGSLDRDFPAEAVLGNGKKYTGISLYKGLSMGGEQVRLVYGNGYGEVKNSSASKLCLKGSLDPAAVKGSIVLCDRGLSARVAKGVEVKEAGGLGMILVNMVDSGEELVADVQEVQTVAMGYEDGNAIRSYALKYSESATATLSLGRTVLDVPAPMLAEFSSRGPNAVSPSILKPDVIAPGLNILAAWTGAAGTPDDGEALARKTGFNIVSGTSMSCPHVSGLAALIKAAYPDWSPSAIKSALMTTAYTLDNTGKPLRDLHVKNLPANPFGIGSGHVDLRRALSPGLVYDISPHEYLAFICSLGYSLKSISIFTQISNANCSKTLSHPRQLNYPSFSVQFRDKTRNPANKTIRRTKVVVRQTRRLKSVENCKETRLYRVSVIKPWWVNITVRPSKLTFRQLNDVKSYTVTFSANKSSKGLRPASAKIVWANRYNTVSSPVALYWA